VAVRGGQPEQRGEQVEHGVLPARWTPERQDCATASPFLVHEYNPTFIILRQSGCTNFEKPFLYLVLGSAEALLVDTGATGADVSGVVDDVLRRKAGGRPPLPLVVVHSHGHGDHTAGDAALRRKPNVRVVDATPEALTELFKINSWPREIGSYDLGGRPLDVVPIPGHQPASIAIYDRRTALLLTGDTLYSGRLYVRDAPAFADSIDRLVTFTAAHPVAHVLGAHIENTRTPFLDYPEGTTFQPEEHVLELGRAHLLELQDALREIGRPLRRRILRDFTVWPVGQ
jgi:glyoxylase-like metal-dependent hydrolase (beta-lactamase superfamily II)